jgi:hypothetical protein
MDLTQQLGQTLIRSELHAQEHLTEELFSFDLSPKGAEAIWESLRDFAGGIRRCLLAQAPPSKVDLDCLGSVDAEAAHGIEGEPLATAAAAPALDQGMRPNRRRTTRTGRSGV